jgi:ribulose-5-phosphate 4-epimerase/fuculose-1-phosphate aldolase
MTTPDETALRLEITTLSRSLFERGFAHGSAGNVSARVGSRILMSPTNSSLGRLDPERLSLVDSDGRHVSGDQPTKEAGLHLGIYRQRPTARAIVHLHSPYATLLSCLADTDPEDALPPITPYLVMRVGRVPMVPYDPPGSDALAAAVARRAAAHAGILMANHGFTVAAASFEDAVNTAEEFEESAKLLVLARGARLSPLDPGAVAALIARFGKA